MDIFRVILRCHGLRVGQLLRLVLFHVLANKEGYNNVDLIM